MAGGQADSAVQTCGGCHKDGGPHACRMNEADLTQLENVPQNLQPWEKHLLQAAQQGTEKP